MSYFICPYCFTRNEEKDILYRCRSGYCKCPPEQDMVYMSYWKKSFNGNRAFPVKHASLQKKSACPDCGESTTIRICPTCHSELPHTFGSYQDETISVIGMKESGKTHYIAMLVKMFGTRISEQFSVSMEIVHDEISKKFKENYGANLDNKSIINETNSGKANTEIRRPLIYKLAFRRKGFLGSKKLEVATVSLFDNAGEDLFFENNIRDVNKCIFNSTGIILIIDPLQIPQVHEQLKIKGMSLPKVHGETKEMLSRVAKVIREQNNISEDQLINTPIAIALSKSDMLKDIIGEGNSMMFQESDHNGNLNKDEIISIHNEVESFLRQWDGSGLLTQIKNNFKNYCFFGFTALGTNPEKGTIRAFRPLRIEDPFLWLLHKRNLVNMK